MTTAPGASSTAALTPWALAYAQRHWQRQSSGLVATAPAPVTRLEPHGGATAQEQEVQADVRRILAGSHYDEVYDRALCRLPQQCCRVADGPPLAGTAAGPMRSDAAPRSGRCDDGDEAATGGPAPAVAMRREPRGPAEPASAPVPQPIPPTAQVDAAREALLSSLCQLINSRDALLLGRQSVGLHVLFSVPTLVLTRCLRHAVWAAQVHGVAPDAEFVVAPRRRGHHPHLEDAVARRSWDVQVAAEELLRVMRSDVVQRRLRRLLWRHLHRQWGLAKDGAEALVRHKLLWATTRAAQRKQWGPAPPTEGPTAAAAPPEGDQALGVGDDATGEGGGAVPWDAVQADLGSIFSLVFEGTAPAAGDEWQGPAVEGGGHLGLVPAAPSTFAVHDPRLAAALDRRRAVATTQALGTARHEALLHGSALPSAGVLMDPSPVTEFLLLLSIFFRASHYRAAIRALWRVEHLLRWYGSSPTVTATATATPTQQLRPLLHYVASELESTLGNPNRHRREFITGLLVTHAPAPHTASGEVPRERSAGPTARHVFPSPKDAFESLVRPAVESAHRPRGVGCEAKRRPVGLDLDPGRGAVAAEVGSTPPASNEPMRFPITRARPTQPWNLRVEPQTTRLVSVAKRHTGLYVRLNKATSLGLAMHVVRVGNGAVATEKALVAALQATQALQTSVEVECVPQRAGRLSAPEPPAGAAACAAAPHGSSDATRSPPGAAPTSRSEAAEQVAAPWLFQCVEVAEGGGLAAAAVAASPAAGGDTPPQPPVRFELRRSSRDVPWPFVLVRDAGADPEKRGRKSAAALKGCWTLKFQPALLRDYVLLQKALAQNADRLCPGGASGAPGDVVRLDRGDVPLHDRVSLWRCRSLLQDPSRRIAAVNGCAMDQCVALEKILARALRLHLLLR